MFKKLIYIVILPIYPVPVSFQPLPGYTGRYWYPFNLYLDTWRMLVPFQPLPGYTGRCWSLSTSTWIHWKILVPFQPLPGYTGSEDIGTLSTSTWIHWKMLVPFQPLPGYTGRCWCPFNLYLDTLSWKHKCASILLQGNKSIK